MESKFNKDLVQNLSMKIPCMHISTTLIADRVISYFITYLENFNNDGKSISNVLFDITGDEKYNG